MSAANLYEAYYVGLTRTTHVSTVLVDPTSHALTKTSSHKLNDVGVTPFVKTLAGIPDRVVSIYHPNEMKVVVSVCKTGAPMHGVIMNAEKECKEEQVEAIRGSVQELQALWLGFGRVLLVYTQDNFPSYVMHGVF